MNRRLLLALLGAFLAGLGAYALSRALGFHHVAGGVVVAAVVMFLLEMRRMEKR